MLNWVFAIFIALVLSQKKWSTPSVQPEVFELLIHRSLAQHNATTYSNSTIDRAKNEFLRFPRGMT